MEPASTRTSRRATKITGLLFAGATALAFLAACGKRHEDGASSPPKRAAGTEHPSTNTLNLQRADVMFFPLGDEIPTALVLTHETRHYARVAVSALAAPHARFTEREAFLVDTTAFKIKPFQCAPVSIDTLLGLGRTFAVRYIVRPITRKTKDNSLEAAIAILDVERQEVVTTCTARGKPKDHSPQTAQKVMLDAAFKTADRLVELLGGNGTAPREGLATPADSYGDHAAAESLLESWDIGSTRKALDLASGAIRRRPADARAWALAARCYARLANDTRRYPARFHRECRLRAVVAADIARSLDPRSTSVLTGAAAALLEGKRRAEAEPLYIQLAGHAGCEADARMNLACIRRRFDVLPSLDGNPTTGANALHYRLGQVRLELGDERESLRAFERLLETDPENVLFGARYCDVRRYIAHPNNHLDAAITYSLPAITQAFADILPAAWELDETGKRIANEALDDLERYTSATALPALDTPENIAAFRGAIAPYPDDKTKAGILEEVRRMAPDSRLFRLLATYGRLDRALTDHLTRSSHKVETPLAFSILDRLRLHTRLVVECCGEILVALQNLGVVSEANRFARRFDAAFPADEVAQIMIGMHYYGRSLQLNPPLVTHHFKKSEAAWFGYVPQVFRRVHWAVANETREQMARRYKTMWHYDRFDPALVYSIAQHLYSLRRWEDAKSFVDEAAKADPYDLDVPVLRLRIERAGKKRQIPKAAVEQVSRDYAGQRDTKGVVADLYYSAGMIPEAEKAYREIWEENRGDVSAFFRLMRLLRLQGRFEAAEGLVGPFIAEHDDLHANRAIRETVDYYAERREYERAAAFLSANMAALDPTQGDTICTLGRLRWLLGERETARAEFERYSRRYGDRMGPRLLAELEAVEGNWEEMRIQGRRLQSALPMKIDGYWLEALYHLHLGNLVEARHVAGNGLIHLIHDEGAFQTYAMFQYYSGFFDAAIRACQTGDRFVHGVHHLWLDMTEVRARLASGDVEGVESIIERMKLFSPAQTWTHVCETLWRLHEQDPAAARVAIEKARRLNSRNTHVQVAYGRVLLAEDQVDAAIEELQFAVDHVHRPQDRTEALFYLGEALKRAGQVDRMNAAYDRLRKLWPTGYWGERAAANLPAKESSEKPIDGETTGTLSRPESP